MTDWLPPTAGGDGQRWLPPERARPGSAPARATAQRSGQATAALVLGIAGLVLLVLSFGFLAIFTLPLSVAAWALGLSARRRADRGEAGGRGTAHAGFVLGVIGTVLAVVAIVALTLLVALDDSFLDDLEREIDAAQTSAIVAVSRRDWRCQVDEPPGSDGAAAAARLGTHRTTPTS